MLTRKIRVLIACEFSGRVRDAFARRDFDAWSCDLLPSETSGQHIQDEVLKHLNDGWDLMIAHPPCTYLSRAGLRWLLVDSSRQAMVNEASGFFNLLLNAPVPFLAVENPVQHRFARKLIRAPDQSIEPFMFGHIEHKCTCLWLKGLPLLNPTSALWDKEPVRFIDKRGGKHYSTDMHSGNNQASKRSRTFPGIAAAMADQWGKYLLQAVLTQEKR